MRGNQVVHCDDITFRNSFPTVDVFSNKLYLLTKYDDANYLKPDLSGTWTEHGDGNTTSISVSKLSDTEFQYIDGAQSVRLTITGHDNPSQTFSVNWHLLDGDDFVNATYDPLTNRLTPDDDLPPNLEGTWQRTVQPTGAVTQTVDFTRDGANYTYIHPVHGPTSVVLTDFDNRDPPSMVVSRIDVAVLNHPLHTVRTHAHTYGSYISPYGGEPLTVQLAAPTSSAAIPTSGASSRVIGRAVRAGAVRARRRRRRSRRT